MDGSKDLTKLLREWAYDEEDNVRFLTGDDGRELMQIRQPLGIEQYDLDGRPDGVRPEGEESLLAYYQKKEREAGESGGSFVIDDDDFRRLHSEGVLFYYRYLALFQVGNYDRVVRDTEHNLGIVRMLATHYKGSARDEMLQYQPYIRRMNAISKAMLYLAEEKNALAVEELEKGKSDIETLEPVSTPIFEFERIRSIQHLSQVLKQVRDEHSDENSEDDRKGFRERLTEELSKAVEIEDYERAAQIRDRINRLD